MCNDRDKPDVGKDSAHSRTADRVTRSPVLIPGHVLFLLLRAGVMVRADL